NADEMRSALGEHRRRVEQVETALERGDAGFLARWIGEAATKRQDLLRDAFEDTAELFRVHVRVADRPGILAAIMQALGAERINIEDLELHHVSRERGGSLTLLIAGAEAARRAADVLGTQGYDVDVAPEIPSYRMATVHAPELLIVMSGAATPEEVEHVVARLEEAGAQANVTPGRQATVIGAIGERELIASLPLEGYPGVESVLPILKP